MIAKITADIHSSESAAAYRVYVNDTLMTERTFKWEPSAIFIRENIVIDGQLCTPYTVKVISLKDGVTFTLCNVTVNERNVESTFTL